MGAGAKGIREVPTPNKEIFAFFTCVLCVFYSWLKYMHVIGAMAYLRCRDTYTCIVPALRFANFLAAIEV